MEGANTGKCDPDIYRFRNKPTKWNQINTWLGPAWISPACSFDSSLVLNGEGSDFPESRGLQSWGIIAPGRVLEKEERDESTPEILPSAWALLLLLKKIGSSLFLCIWTWRAHRNSPASLLCFCVHFYQYNHVSYLWFEMAEGESFRP